MFSKSKVKAQEQKPVVITTDADYALTPAEDDAISSLPVDSDGMVLLGDVAHNVLGEQTQYLSYFFLGGVRGYPSLVGNLRTDSSSFSYHSYRIHGEDVREFVARVRAYRRLSRGV